MQILLFLNNRFIVYLFIFGNGGGNSAQNLVIFCELLKWMTYLATSKCNWNLLLKSVTAYISSKTCFVYTVPVKMLKNLVRWIQNWSEIHFQINQKISKASKNNHSLTNLPKVGEDLLRALCKLFYLQISVSSDQWKNTM